MNRQTKLITAGFAALSVALAVALGVALATDNDTDGMPSMNGDGDGYMGMMQAFGRMDSDEMLSMMRMVLSPEEYDQMVEHFAEHQSGSGMTDDMGIDGMMHRMMDGFFERMPADQGEVMPMGPR